MIISSQRDSYQMRGEPKSIGSLSLQAASQYKTEQSLHYGVVNPQKHWIIEPLFYKYVSLPGNYYLLYNGGKNPYRLIITPTGQMYEIGKTLFAENVGEISTADVDDPWFAVRDIYDRNCYINKEGEVVLRVSYSQCNHFSEGLAAVKDGALYGYINREGKMAILPEFVNASNFSNSLASVQREGSKTYDVIDITGKPVFETDYVYLSAFQNKCAISGNGKKFGLINDKGEALLPPKYDSIIFNGEVYLLGKNKKWGVYVPETSTIVEPLFSEISSYGKQVLVVKHDGKYGLLSLTSGEYIQKPKYITLVYYGEGIYLAETAATSNLISESGELLLSVNSDYVFHSDKGFKNGLAPVSYKGKWGYISNPIVYSDWRPEAVLRSREMRALPISDENYTITINEFYDLISDFLKNQRNFHGAEYFQIQNIKNCFESTGENAITRQQIALILADVSKAYGNFPEYYENFCFDADKVGEEYKGAVAYIASLGIIDTSGNIFSPMATVDQQEALSILTLFFEEMLDSNDRLKWGVYYDELYGGRIYMNESFIPI